MANAGQIWKQRRDPDCVVFPQKHMFVCGRVEACELCICAWESREEFPFQCSATATGQWRVCTDNPTGRGKREVHARPDPLPPFPPKVIWNFRASVALSVYKCMSLIDLWSWKQWLWRGLDQKGQEESTGLFCQLNLTLSLIQSPPFGLQGNMGPLMYETEHLGKDFQVYSKLTKE